MKKLSAILVVMLALAGQAWGKPPEHILGSYNLHGNYLLQEGQVGVLDLTPVGTVPYCSPGLCDAFQMAGPFSAANYFTNDSLLKALTSTARTAYHISFDTTLTAGSTYQIFYENASGANIFAFQQSLAKIWWAWNSGSVFSTHALSFNACHHFDIYYNYLASFLFVDGVLEIFQNSTSSAFTPGTFDIGLDAGSWPLTSALSNMVFTDLTPKQPTLARTPCPQKTFTSYPSNPVMIATQVWEGIGVGEPSVLYDASHTPKWMMCYGGGFFASPALGLATSTDGRTWTHSSSPIIGNGAGGETSYALGGNLTKISGGYRIDYCSGDAIGGRSYATSSDGSAWTVIGICASTSILPGFNVWYDSATVDGGSGTMFMLATGHCSGPPSYRVCCLYSTDSGVTFLPYFFDALWTMNVGGTPGGMWGGEHTIHKVNGVYHTWYHAGYLGGDLPCNVWHAYSPDLLYWYPDTTATILIAGNEMGLAACNQVENPSAVEVNGESRIYFDANDNTNHTAKIGYVSYAGTLDDACDCALVTPTPTPVPSKSGSLYLRDSLKLRL